MPRLKRLPSPLRVEILPDITIQDRERRLLPTLLLPHLQLLSQLLHHAPRIPALAERVPAEHAPDAVRDDVFHFHALFASVCYDCFLAQGFAGGEDGARGGAVGQPAVGDLGGWGALRGVDEDPVSYAALEGEGLGGEVVLTA